MACELGAGKGGDGYDSLLMREMQTNDHDVTVIEWPCTGRMDRLRIGSLMNTNTMLYTRVLVVKLAIG